jgi:hypothetical protein
MKLTLGGLALAVFFVLAGCGVTPTSTGGAATNGTNSGANTTSGTSTTGPIVISTDHSAYAPTDAIHVTIANHLGTAIYAYNHQASCSIVGLEMQTSSGWQDVATMQKPIAGCAQKSVTQMVTVAAGATYDADIVAGYLRQGDADFAAGSYRLRLAYLSTPLAMQPGAPPAPEATPGYQMLYSATFTVSANVPPQPIPTAPAASGSGSGGTAVAGTVVVSGTAHP